MPRLVFLGSASAVANELRENTHFAIVEQDRIILVDCINNPILRLKLAGLDYTQVTDLVLTHFHPDHVSGVPLLLMNSWLLGRRNLLRMHGLAHTLERVQTMMDLYSWRNWPNFYPVEFHTLEERPLAPVLDFPTLRILASPVRHFVPTIGLRIEFPLQSKVIAYSGDTEPCPEVIRLAEDADVLIHEATGVAEGHSSAAQAGSIAAQAHARSLYLIHYRTWGPIPPVEEEARQAFKGPVVRVEDFMELAI